LVLYLRGSTMNMMVLAGLLIAVAIVVDDVILDMENIVRRLRQYRREGSDKSTASIILEASLEMRSAMIFATLIMLLALVPIFLLGGVSGAFFQPLVISYALALLASLVIALTITPALCLLLLRNVSLERRESPLLRWLQHSYNGVLRRIIRTPYPAFATVCGFVLIGMAVLPFLGESLFP